MNVLPWLFDWPPNRASVALFLFLTAFSVGTLVLFGGVTDESTSKNVTVEATDLSVHLNDDTDPLDAANGTVQKCLASGTPGDSILVVGDVTVDVPADWHGGSAGDPQVTLVMSLAHTEETTTETVSGTGRATTRVFWVLDDDETLSAGDTAEFRVRARADDSTVANATRAVTVRNDSRSYDC